MTQPTKLLTIGGSDSGGAAGIQADLRAWAATGQYGMSAITVVTAQNSVGVRALQFVSAELLRQQIDAVLQDYGAAGIKTGFIGRVDLIEQVADTLAAFDGPIVIDPVLVNHKGVPLFDDATVDAYRERLLPLATVVTPNVYEAALLSGDAIEDRDSAAAAAERLLAMQAAAVLIKRIAHAGQLCDVLYTAAETHQWCDAPIVTTNTHGSGDTLSALLLAQLVQGASPKEASAAARDAVRQAISTALAWKMGDGHGPIWPLPTPS